MRSAQLIPPCLLAAGITVCLASLSLAIVLLNATYQEEDENTSKTLFASAVGVGVVGTLCGFGLSFYSRVVSAKQDADSQASSERDLESGEATPLVSENGEVIMDPKTGYTNASRPK